MVPRFDGPIFFYIFIPHISNIMGCITKKRSIYFSVYFVISFCLGIFLVDKIHSYALMPDYPLLNNCTTMYLDSRYTNIGRNQACIDKYQTICNISATHSIISINEHYRDGRGKDLPFGSFACKIGDRCDPLMYLDFKCKSSEYSMKELLTLTIMIFVVLSIFIFAFWCIRSQYEDDIIPTGRHAYSSFDRRLRTNKDLAVSLRRCDEIPSELQYIIGDYAVESINNIKCQGCLRTLILDESTEAVYAMPVLSRNIRDGDGNSIVSQGANTIGDVLCDRVRAEISRRPISSTHFCVDWSIEEHDNISYVHASVFETDPIRHIPTKEPPIFVTQFSIEKKLSCVRWCS